MGPEDCLDGEDYAEDLVGVRGVGKRGWEGAPRPARRSSRPTRSLGLASGTRSGLVGRELGGP